MISKKDTIYSTPQSNIKDFCFDENVVDVFSDMLNRSIPGYGTITRQVGIFAKKYVTPNSHIYDLGCSLGASTLAIRHSIPFSNCRIFSIDASKSMVKKCRLALNRDVGVTPVELKHEDICTSPMENASFIVMNFTLQFIKTAQKKALTKKIYDSLKPGGALVLSEKTISETPTQQKEIEELYFDFKRANGYNDLEISQKRDALENVLELETETEHLNRLKGLGFKTHFTWFRALNFISILAVK